MKNNGYKYTPDIISKILNDNKHTNSKVHKKLKIILEEIMKFELFKTDIELGGIYEHKIKTINNDLPMFLKQFKNLPYKITYKILHYNFNNEKLSENMNYSLITYHIFKCFNYLDHDLKDICCIFGVKENVVTRNYTKYFNK